MRTDIYVRDSEKASYQIGNESVGLIFS